MLMASRNSFAQINLVPNPSFEDTVYCPFGTNQIDACANWLNFGNSPDYFNTCSNPAFAVPNSIFGFQYPHTGDAMAGSIFYLRPNHPSGPNYREPIGIELINNLTVGQKYFVSFYVVNAEVNFGSVACNKIGANFSTVPFDSCCPIPTLNIAKLYSDSVIVDTLDWYKISGSFIADSTYQYLVISNFFEDINTDTIVTSPFPTLAYYYIDDVCVTTDSLFNETWTGLDQISMENEMIRIFPNPTTDFISLESTSLITRYDVFSSLGQLLTYKSNLFSHSLKIDLRSLQRGIYILKLYTTHQTRTYKIVLTH